VKRLISDGTARAWRFVKAMSVMFIDLAAHGMSERLGDRIIPAAVGAIRFRLDADPGNRAAPSTNSSAMP